MSQYQDPNNNNGHSQLDTSNINHQQVVAREEAFKATAIKSAEQGSSSSSSRSSSPENSNTHGGTVQGQTHSSTSSHEEDSVVSQRPAQQKPVAALSDQNVSTQNVEEVKNDVDGDNHTSKSGNLMKKLVMPANQVATERRDQDGGLDVSSGLFAVSPADDATGLLYYNREPLKLKEFHTEVRALMDVEQFAHQAELMLDVKDISMDGIIDAMLMKVVENDTSNNKLSDLRDAIFIPGSSMLMARTIQGFSSMVEFEDRGHQTKTSLKHDQSWLCALCNLAQVSKRHMVIARFKQPINMGENAHEVRLFVLIIVPTVEKSTKDQVETGRTFATMLTDAQFRQELFRANNENEFKALMLVKAQQLARAQKLRNRHKYQLDAALHHSISLTSLNSIQNGNSVEMISDGKSPRQTKSSMGYQNVSNLNNQRDLESFYGENPRTGKLFELIAKSASPGDNESLSSNGNNLKQRIVGPKADEPRHDENHSTERVKVEKSACCCGLWNYLEFGTGAWSDFKRRLSFYPSDFKDAFVGPPRTIQKTVATIWFLYFGILLPTIAFSSLNTHQTHGHMGDLRKAIIGQAIGGLAFALLGGQPIVIIMTTAPLCLYTKVIHQMCLDYGFHFPAMYAAVGLWNGFFLIIYSLFGFSKLMKWCTRSTEEIFALFIVVAFITDAGKDMMKNFKRFYYSPACAAQNNVTSSVLINATQTMMMPSHHLLHNLNHSSHDSFRDIEDEIEGSICRRETSLLFVLLMLGTLWLSVTLYKFKRTPYLSAGKRDILADYALPTAVILMSLLGSTIFDDIYVEKFPPLVDIHFERAPIESLSWSGVLTSMGLGFTLSLLFFMDQNISAAMVSAPQNKLKKGSAYHYDLLIVGLLNGGVSLYGLPMMHGVLPHSPLHARSLADIEDQVEEGHLRQVVVNSRETRVTAIVSHILILGSLLLIPYPIAYIPRAVLNGLFLFMAITSLDGLQVFERILLLVTEQSKYPPNHYIRRCPQRKIHQFTMLQLVQLIVMCMFGFSPINIVEMFFPVIILLMIPFRHRVVPKYINEKYLDALDGKH